jgi:hypothetical protein
MDNADNAGSAAESIRLCASCGAPIIWRIHDRTRKRAPINAEPAAGGTIVLLPGGTYYRVYTAQQLAAARPRTLLYTNHFVTCPAAKQWAKHGGRDDR